MTADDLDRLDALARAATPGPWGLVGNTVYIGPNWIALPGNVATAEFIAAAREAVPALVAALRAERERVGELERRVGELEGATKI